MVWKAFFQFVEIQTKLASITPFLLGNLYAIYRYSNFKAGNFVIMLISLLCFDMATTAINNFIDLTKAHQPTGYNFERGKVLVKFGLTNMAGLAIIFTLLTVAGVAGILLVYRTDIIVLLLGLLSFGIGVFYTFGPLPISRMPLGEIFSGIFMGFVIIFLSIYIHVFDLGLVTLGYKLGMINLSFNLSEIIVIFLLSIPAIGSIANIMLANNICDLNEDILNKRFTLPYYLGLKNSLRLFAGLYYIAYIDIIILVVLKILPALSLVVLLTYLPVQKNIKQFYETQQKDKTFVLSIKNFVLINVTQLVIMLVTLIVRL